MADKEEVEPTEKMTGAPKNGDSESSGSSLSGSSLSGSSLSGSSLSGSALSDSALSGSSDYNGSASEPEESPVESLDGDDDASGDAEGDLVAVGAPRRRSTRGTAAPGSVVKASRGPKGRPTPSRRGEAAKKERTGPVKFVRESIGELRKVVYPTGQQVVQYFVVVLVFVLFIIAYVSLLDLGLGAALFKIFS